MENAELIGLSRQAALRRQLDIIANNLANMNTTGFKTGNVPFEEYLMPGAMASGFTGDDRTLSYVQEGAPLTDYSAGPLRETANPLDFAIDGDDAWFVVSTPEGERYTRAGAFTLDAAGTLATPTGNPVLGDGGPIQFSAADTDITVSPDGTISSANGPVGRLRLVQFDDPTLLQREGDTLYSGPAPQPATGVHIVQGAVEQSNVRAVVEMARLVEVTRSYTNLARTLSQADELNVDAINQLGQVSA